MNLKMITTLSLLLAFLLAVTGCAVPAETDAEASFNQETKSGTETETETAEETPPAEVKPQSHPLSLHQAGDILTTMETISINWFNHTTDKTFYFDGTFRIERLEEDGTWVDCTPEAPIYDLTVQTVPTRTVIGREYNITGFDLSRDVPYRFISQYNETEDSRDNVEIILEFALGYNFKMAEPQQAELFVLPDGTTKSVTYYSFRSGGSSRDGEDDKYFRNNPELAEIYGTVGDITPYINADRFDLNGVRPIPLVRIDSTEDIELLKQYNGSRPFQFLADSYDAEFFSTKTLFLLSFHEGSGSIRHSIDTPITIDGHNFYIKVSRTAPELQTADMLYCEILIEIEREDISACTVFDAWMD